MPRRFLLDENSGSAALMTGLLALGAEVETVARLGRRGRSDRDHLEFAAREAWVIFTFDVADFARLHREWLSAGLMHAGIVVEPSALLPVGEILRRFEKLLRAEESLAGRLLYLGDFR